MGIEGRQIGISPTETQRDMILDGLREMLPRNVADEIINWGNLGIFRGIFKGELNQSIGLRLKIEAYEDGEIHTARIRYFRLNKSAKIWISDSRWAGQVYRGEIREIINIKLGERLEGREKTLCFWGMVEGEPEMFEVTRDGYLHQVLISYADYYDMKAELTERSQ